MSERNTTVRSMHDLGLAAWFGGSLMGAVGLNGATAKARDPQERLRLSSKGWGRWTPIQVAAVGAHLVGSVGMLSSDTGRLRTQKGGRQNTVAKTVLTAVAMGTTAYSGVLGSKVADMSEEGAHGATEPHASASADLAAAQKRLQALQWITPVVTGALVVLAAQQGEQQRPLTGFLKR